MSESIIAINQRYKSSTRIDVDSANLKPFIDDFIVHGTAINVLDTVSREFEGSTQRAYTITGPYGSGKSTVALFLSCLLSTDSDQRNYALSKLNSSQKVITEFDARFKITNGWKTIKHVCGLEAPANSILISLLKAFNVKYNTEDILALNDDECLAKIKSLLQKQSDNEDGVLILLDEMGKALDYQSRANKDLHLFQSLADIVQQTKRPVLLVGFLHQAFSDYAKNKDVKTQQEWSKVQGRYRDLSFNPSIDESLILVGDSIFRAPKVVKAIESKYEKLVDAVSSAFVNQNKNVDALSNTLPLDPIVSLLLGPVSRRRFSQNERSLFGFLASHEKYGFREFLETEYSELNEALNLYRPEMYWDYLHHNLHHLIVTSQDSKAWLEGCDAIYRAEQKGGELHTAITKLIALLTIFGFHHQLHGKRDFIKKYFVSRGYEAAEIMQSLIDLETWTVIIYRQKHDALFVFQGSDIDINNLINERIEAISYGVDWTEICDIPQNILATAHYHKTGTMRWATTKLINKYDVDLIKPFVTQPKTGEAFATFILCVNGDIAKALKPHEEAMPFSIVGKFEDFSNLKNAAIGLIALKQILKDEKKITHDLIAKNELENRIKFAQSNVDHELQYVYKNADWFHCGKKLDTAPLTSIASKIANDLFNKSPVVINELVNRSKPSGSANSAIRKLMNAMFRFGDEKDLGFDEKSFPPEKGLYLSCLKSKGWHCETPEGFLFPSEWSKDAIKANPKMHELFESGFEFIKKNSTTKQVTMAELYEMWMLPPYGLTAGLCRIYGLALLKSLEGQVAFYDWDSTNQFIFIPELDEELVNKIYKHPIEAGVRYFEISEIQSHLLDNLAQATLGEVKNKAVILNIAKHIVGIVHKLPAWVKKTSGESFTGDKTNGLTKQARDFRNKVIAANDPFKLILDDLPAVFGFKKDDPTLEDKLGSNLKIAIEDLSAQHEMLLTGFKQIIINMLGEDFNSVLKARCDIVEKEAKRPKVKDLANRLSQFIDGKSKFEFVINILTGVPEPKWTDKLLRTGLDELQNLCVQFRRIESFSNLQAKGTSKPLAFLTTDSNGNHLEFGSFIKHDLAIDADVKSAVSSIQESIATMPKEKQLAALTSLLTNLMDQTESEVLDDGKN
ncbi:AAA family ATPase [Pseudoalteromonas sp. NZS100_1]|uniref:AAA family ATPase n=1 Tax=Pseudoalteromonas sp. NZS100_1 TaxID=2792073 RepID=UPI0018CF2C0E|nr:AAA family ATPase [Pseudoalteromonas sp. NZS100_1]MBH0011438.1 AAA family ATPase [Pseudoalteromonas sp. NZS100_1]